MKPIIKALIYSVFIVVIFFIGLKIGNTKTKQQTYTATDSLQMVKIDSVKGEYQQVIDSLLKIKPKIEYKVKVLRERDTLIYFGGDSVCSEIINRKDNLIQGLDSLVELLDVEARTYSDMLILSENKLKLQSKMYESLIFKNDSTSKSVQDSLISQLKLKKRSLFWQKIKTGVVAIAGTTAIIYSNVK